MRGGARIGAGRPRTNTVVYYRKVKPEWVKILDELLDNLKNTHKKTE